MNVTTKCVPCNAYGNFGMNMLVVLTFGCIEVLSWLGFNCSFSGEIMTSVFRQQLYVVQSIKAGEPKKYWKCDDNSWSRVSRFVFNINSNAIICTAVYYLYNKIPCQFLMFFNSFGDTYYFAPLFIVLKSIEKH